MVYENRNKPTTAQRRGITFTVAGLILMVVVLIIGMVIAMVQRAALGMSNEELAERGLFLFEQPRNIGEFELVNHDGEAFTHEDLQGHWSLLFFGFTYCPDICPTTMADLGRLYRQLEPELAASTRVYLVSVDPARDTPEQMREYTTFFDPSFTGVTGEFMELHRVATSLSIPFMRVPGGGDNYLVEHSGNIVVMNERGHHIGFFRAPHDLEQLLVTYRALRQR